MGQNKELLKELTKPLYGFDGKSIKPIGVITLLVSFGTPQTNNLRHCRYAILNIFKAY
jgi:hypothetical protein